MSKLTTNPETLNTTSKEIIEIEISALEKWNSGNPSGFLEISADDVTYFDPYNEQRLDGIENLAKLYESLRGQIKVNKYKMINPIVKVSDKMAVLTYNLISYFEGGEAKWNCTEVYRLDNKKWKIIQTHWSYTKPNIQR